MGDFINWAVTPLLPPPPPLPDRSKREGRYAGLPPPPAEQALYTTVDKLAMGLYNWVIRPLSSPLGMATAAAGPAISSGAIPMRYIVAGGGALGGHGAIQEGKAGQWMPSTESPGALLNATLAATPAAVAAWLPHTRASLIKPKTSTPSQSVPDVVPNPSRRQFLKQAGPVAAGTALGAPAAVKVAGKVASWGEKGAAAAPAASTASTVAAAEWVPIGTKVRYMGGSGTYHVTKIYKNSAGDIAHDTVLHSGTKAGALEHASESVIRQAEQKALSNESGHPYGSATEGSSGGPYVQDEHLYVETSPATGPAAVHRRVNFVHPEHGRVIDVAVARHGETVVTYMNAAGDRHSIIFPRNTTKEQLRAYAGDVIADAIHNTGIGHIPDTWLSSDMYELAPASSKWDIPVRQPVVNTLRFDPSTGTTSNAAAYGYYGNGH
jgi:hypothetical protein